MARGSAMRRLLDCRKGNFAVAFAVAIMPVMGAAGLAVDYTRAANVRSFIQSQADMTAFAGAQLGKDGDAQRFLDYLDVATRQRYGDGDWVGGLSVNAAWVSAVDYRVSVTGSVPVSILGAVPGFPSSVPISVSSTVRVAAPRYVYTPPTVNELDNEAGDYNRVYVYCFDPDKKNDPKTKGRTQMTAISDNAGTKYDYTMPRCNAGEALSYKLLNVRLVRDQPKKWDDPKQQRFEFYTDTVLDDGKEKYDVACEGKSCSAHPTQKWSIVETVLCASLDECKPRSQGGIIPEGKNRNPVQAKKGCSPGQYMYYGWEDRPPGMKGASADWTDIAWTDRDYDDIRIVIGCPVLESVEDRMVRLID